MLLVIYGSHCGEKLLCHSLNQRQGQLCAGTLEHQPSGSRHLKIIFGHWGFDSWSMNPPSDGWVSLWVTTLHKKMSFVYIRYCRSGQNLEIYIVTKVSYHIISGYLTNLWYHLWSSNTRYSSASSCIMQTCPGAISFKYFQHRHKHHLVCQLV